MKSAKSNKSLRSIKSSRSVRSTKTNIGSKRGDAGGEFLDLGNILPTACAKFQCPYSVAVKKEQQRDEFYKALKYGDITAKRKRLSIMPPQPIASPQQSDVKTLKSNDSKSIDESLSMDFNTITVIAVYDTYNCLSEILLQKNKIPRKLMQVIGLLVPYFQNLTTFKVHQCRIDCYTIHEIGKMLEFSSITTVCLEDAPVLEQNYDELINEQSNLRSLSLCRCKMDDDGCKLIAAKLHYGASAQNLQLLNLSSNHITDIGAKYLSDALRSNRCLRYLNLADNHITDNGAGYILDVLIEFPLTYDEISNKRIRHLKYLKCKQALYLRYLNECDNSSFDALSQLSRKSATKRKRSNRKDTLTRNFNSDDNIKIRAEMLASEILGQFTDPFDSNSVKYRDRYYYCVGNMRLSYLNLSYNNLSFLIVKKIQKVVMYQNVTKKSNQSGLVKVVFDGNNLPSSMCKELVLLSDLLARNIKNFISKPEFNRRKK